MTIPLFEYNVCYACARTRACSVLQKDKKKYGCLSPFQSGFRSLLTFGCRKNILLVTQGHSGRADCLWERKALRLPAKHSLADDLRLNSTLEDDAVKSSRMYHFAPAEYSTYYQYEIRSLLQGIRHRYNWRCTDLVKCYISNGKSHFTRSSAVCNHYLRKQIENFRADLIIIFGNLSLSCFVVNNADFDVDKKFLTKYKHKSKTHVRKLNKSYHHGDIIGIYHGSRVMFSQFPSQSTANKWTKLEKNGVTLLDKIRQTV